MGWQVHLQPMPQLAGKSFGELAGFFPDAVVFGILQHSPQQCCINPPHSMVLQPRDEVIFIRPTHLTGPLFQPLTHPVEMDAGMLHLGSCAHWSISVVSWVCPTILTGHLCLPELLMRSSSSAPLT